MSLHTVLVRDDDISYFTDLEQFTRVHRFLLERGLPFNVAAIPAASTAIDAAATSRKASNPRSQVKVAYHELYRAKELTAFFSSRPQIEVAQHGYQHVRQEDGTPEFASESAGEIRHRILEGKAIIQGAFGREPRFFVPPFDTVSPTAMAIIKNHYDGISLSRYSHSLLPPYLWFKFAVNKWQQKHLLRWQKFIVLSHPGSDLIFLRHDEPLNIHHLPAKDVLVVTVHSWMFFDAAGMLKETMLQRYETLLAALASSPKIRFKRFSDLA